MGRKKTDLQAFFFFFTQKKELKNEGGRLNTQREGRVQEKEREGLQSWSGQRLPGAEEFMVDLSLFAAGLQ